MPSLVPVDNDPFAAPPPAARTLVPVDHDPFAPPAPTPVYSGTLLPFTRYSDGSVAFDPHAGILAPFTAGVALTKAAATGQLTTDSLPDVAGAAAKAALSVAPMAPADTLLTRAAVVPPTALALHQASSAGYDAARDTGVEYAAPAVAEMARNAQADLNARGIIGVNAPKTHAILDLLQDVPEGGSVVPFGSLHAARKAFGFTAADPTEQGAGKSVQAAIDGFLTQPPAGAVAPALDGPAASAAALLAEANKNAAAGFRSDSLNGIERAADLRSSSANSGANIGNSTRQRITSLLLDKNASAGFDPDEIAALEGVVHGSMAANAARKLANMAGGGGGIAHSMITAAGIGVGQLLGDEAGAMIGGTAAGAVGPALKAVQNKLDTGALAAADAAVRSRSPLFEQMQAGAPLVNASPLTASSLAAAARIPVTDALMGPGAAASVNNAAPDSRAAALAQTLSQARQPQGGGLGAIFATPGTI